MASKEGASGLLMFAVGINLFNVGVWIGRTIGKDRANTPERVEHVQEHNAQIYEQLDRDYDGIGRLILNDETDTYEFHLTPEGEQPQVCEGEYQVTDSVAQLTGDIACTTTVAVGEN